MLVCETCGDDYEPSSQIRVPDQPRTFHSFQCAIRELAVKCAACSVPVVGSGLRVGQRVFCCALCVRAPQG